MTEATVYHVSVRFDHGAAENLAVHNVVVANGRTIIFEREIPGITGGALDSNEGEPGPILFQGDHGAVEYRNIIITPAK